VRIVQAKDISTEDFLTAIGKALALTPNISNWTNCFQVAEILEVPKKVALAKFRTLRKQGLVDGCDCGCRGDWMIIARGQDEFPLVLDGRNDGSVIHAEDLRKTAREWRREK